MTLTFVLNNRGNNCLRHNNYLFYRTDRNYFKCKACKYTVSTTGETEHDEIIRESDTPHDHMQMSDAEIECQNAQMRMKMLAQYEPSESFSKIFNNELRRLHEFGISKNDTSLYIPPLESFRYTLYKRRRLAWPALPAHPAAIDFDIDLFHYTYIILTCHTRNSHFNHQNL